MLFNETMHKYVPPAAPQIARVYNDGRRTLLAPSPHPFLSPSLSLFLFLSASVLVEEVQVQVQRPAQAVGAEEGNTNNQGQNSK